MLWGGIMQKFIINGGKSLRGEACPPRQQKQFAADNGGGIAELRQMLAAQLS